MTTSLPSLPTPAFVSDGRGVVVLKTSGRSAGELRALAAAAETLEKATRGAPIHALEFIPGPIEFRGLASLMAKGYVTSGAPATVSFPDGEGAAGIAARAGLHVWKVDGADGVLFASTGAPAYALGVQPVSPQTDWAQVAKRTVRLIRKDAAPTDPGSILPEKQIVYGVVLQPEVTDSQGDIYSPEEVERAAHKYLEDFQNIGHQHATLINESARVVESYLAPVDFELGGQPVQAGTWVLVVHVLNDDLWRQIKDGSLTGYSIGGTAQRVPVGTSSP